MYRRYQNRATGTDARGAMRPILGARDADARGVASPLTPTLSPRAGRGSNPGDRTLRGHLAHEVALADLDAEATENVVSRRRMEIKVRHRKVIEIDLRAEV